MGAREEAIALRIQWAKSPRGFDSPSRPRPGYLTRLNLASCSTTTTRWPLPMRRSEGTRLCDAERRKSLERYRAGPAGGGGGGAPAGGGGMLEGAFAVLVQR